MSPLSLTLLGMAMIGAEPLRPGDHTRSFDIAQRTRSYLVHVPTTYDDKKSTPVVLAFHGGLTDAEIMMHFSGLTETADQRGFIVVFPNGTGIRERALTWNGGNCCGYAQRNNVDDVAFVRALLDDLTKVANVDPRRIYATGISNGAVISYRLADEMSDRIAAIAAVAGPMGTDSCSPKRAVPILHFHGTADEFAPYEGGRGPRSVSQTDFVSVDHTINAWVKANGCEKEPSIEQLKLTHDDGMPITRFVWLHGRDGAEVVLYKITGGGHTWPGRQPRWQYLGPSTTNLSANDVMWDFFQQHPLP